MNKLTWCFLLFVMFFCGACGDDEVVLDNTVFGNCLVNGVADDDVGDISISCQNSIIENSITCELITISDEATLTDIDKEWLPFYCFNEGDSIFYSNGEGDRISLKVENMEYSSIKRIVTGDTCMVDTSKRVLYCVKSERARIALNSLALGVDFSLEIEPYLWDHNSGSINYNGVSISLYEVLPSDFELDTKSILFSMVYPPTDITRFLTQYFEALEIHGETFEDVYYYQNFFDEDALQIYYNKTYGIVSIIDKNGIQWLINK